MDCSSEPGGIARGNGTAEPAVSAARRGRLGRVGERSVVATLTLPPTPCWRSLWGGGLVFHILWASLFLAGCAVLMAMSGKPDHNA